MKTKFKGRLVLSKLNWTGVEKLTQKIVRMLHQFHSNQNTLDFNLRAKYAFDYCRRTHLRR